MTSEGVSVKQLLLGLMLLVTAGAAGAEWAVVDESDRYIQLVDKATIQRNGNLVKMWDLKDFKTAQKIAASGYHFLSSKAQTEYDCKEEKQRLLAFTWFDGQMGNGKVVYTDNRTDEWSPIAPGSVDKVLWKIACGKK